MDLKLEVKKETEYTLISIDGEIDLYNARQLKEKVTQAAEHSESPNMIMDLKGVDYIDSTGLGILIGIKRRAAEKGGKLVLVLRSDRINKLFEITGLKNIFNICNSVEEAGSKLQ